MIKKWFDCISLNRRVKELNSQVESLTNRVITYKKMLEMKDYTIKNLTLEIKELEARASDNSKFIEGFKTGTAQRVNNIKKELEEAKKSFMGAMDWVTELTEYRDIIEKELEETKEILKKMPQRNVKRAKRVLARKLINQEE